MTSVLMAILRSAGKSIIWNITVVDIQRASYIQITSKTVGGASEIVFTLTEDKYTVLSINYDLIVTALETLGLLSNKRSTFLPELGRRLSSPLKITAKRLSYSNAYPLPCTDSMSFTIVTAPQFKSKLT